MAPEWVTGRLCDAGLCDENYSRILLVVTEAMNEAHEAHERMVRLYEEHKGG